MMHTPTPVSALTKPLLTAWTDNQRQTTLDFIDDYFERTADWSNSTRDMGLTYEIRETYAALYIEGDFYVETGWRMCQFALEDDETVILVAEDDDGAIAYYPLISG